MKPKANTPDPHEEGLRLRLPHLRGGSKRESEGKHYTFWDHYFENSLLAESATDLVAMVWGRFKVIPSVDEYAIHVYTYIHIYVYIL